MEYGVGRKRLFKGNGNRILLLLKKVRQTFGGLWKKSLICKINTMRIMKVEEPVLVYKSTPSVANLRKRIVHHVEREDNLRVLQQLLVYVEQAQSGSSLKKKVSQARSNRKIVISKRIKALSAVPPTLDDGDYKEDFVDATSEKYM